jgi:hypothetical protein
MKKNVVIVREPAKPVFENSCPRAAGSCKCLMHAIQRKIRWEACPRCLWPQPALRGSVVTGACLCVRKQASISVQWAPLSSRRRAK